MRTYIYTTGLAVTLLLTACQDKTKTKESHLDSTTQDNKQELIQSNQTKTVHSRENTAIGASVDKVTKARQAAARVITSALGAVETGELEDKIVENPSAEMLAKDKMQTQGMITQAVDSVEMAKKASAVKISASVKAVEAARAASPVDAPAAVGILDAVKARASTQVADAVALVEVSKAKAASSMARATADVESTKRVYGEDSTEHTLAKTAAIGVVAKAVGEVKKAEAKALGNISESVAEVEIAKVKAGIKPDEVLAGQTLYLQALKRDCGISGADFAKKHTKSEWEALKSDGSFAKEVQGICPSLKVFKATWTQALFPYVSEYACDSETIPSCR